MNKWDQRFLELAKLVSTWSKDPSTKCGAAIVRPDKTVCSVGFNGFPKGCSDDAGLYDDRELKYERVVHAEVNAILHANEDVHGYTMYTFPPAHGPTCSRCATNVIQSGIKKVVHLLPPEGVEFAEGRWEDSLRIGFQMYKEAGIEIVHIPLEEWDNVV
jgi:dCMP deaminase